MDTLEVHANGSKATSNTTKKQTKDEKPKRYLPSLPTVSGASDMSSVSYSALADKTAVEWSALKNYEVFSLSADGSFPMMKVSRSKAVRIGDREVILVGGGRCYRVAVSPFPTTSA